MLHVFRCRYRQHENQKILRVYTIKYSNLYMTSIFIVATYLGGISVVPSPGSIATATATSEVLKIGWLASLYELPMVIITYHI